MTEDSGPAPRPDDGRRARRALSLAAVAAMAAGIFIAAALDSGAAAAPPAAEVPVGGPQDARTYEKFPHTEPQHARLPCLLCHRRETNDARPKLPGHMPCAGCHQQQLANPASPICAICHSDPASGAVKAFPRMRSFDVAFDHAAHVRGAARSRSGCATCHKPARRGVALSIPAGFGAHSTCFQCHSPRAESNGKDISSCGVCHRVGGHTRMAETALAFSRNFSHAEHQRKGLGCGDCHSVRAGVSRARQVTSPAPEQHHAPANVKSCASCHDDKRAFGGDDFSDCTRCHEGTAWRFGRE